MFGKRMKLFTLMGFEVYIDLSWLVLAFLITWTLAVGFFPARYPYLAPETYWWMGAFGALGLFTSIIFHEFAHSIVARRYDIPMKGITLFIFGGVAEMTDEPPTPKSEFLMAIAGPIASVIAGLGFLAIAQTAAAANASLPVIGVLGYLGLINIILAIFNMVPAFPLDGGRVLRSILWGVRKDLHWATRIASAIGSGFGFLLIALGIFSFLTGNVIGGIWWFVLGLFIRSASQTAFQQMINRELLHGEPVRNFMRTEPVTVPSSATVQDLVDDYIYKHHHKLFPVVDNGRLSGYVTISSVKGVPKEQRTQRAVGEIAQPCNPENTIPPDFDAVDALSLMYRQGVSRLIVAEDGKLDGILALKDLLSFLAMKMELEGGRPETILAGQPSGKAAPPPGGLRTGERR
jgi:Zn-dependent protease/CBS domain-containing protein